MYHRFRISDLFFTKVRSSKEDNLVTGEVADWGGGAGCLTGSAAAPPFRFAPEVLSHGLDLVFQLGT